MMPPAGRPTPQKRRHHGHRQPARTFARLHHAPPPAHGPARSQIRHLRNSTTWRASVPPEAPPRRRAKLEATPSPTATVTPSSSTEAESRAPASTPVGRPRAIRRPPTRRPAPPAPRGRTPRRLGQVQHARTQPEHATQPPHAGSALQHATSSTTGKLHTRAAARRRMVGGG
jgi:hypothetical protein